MRYLEQHAFRVPTMFLDPEILRRIEQEAVVDRVRTAQVGVMGSLLSPRRLSRLVEYEARR